MTCPAVSDGIVARELDQRRHFYARVVSADNFHVSVQTNPKTIDGSVHRLQPLIANQGRAGAASHRSPKCQLDLDSSVTEGEYGYVPLKAKSRRLYSAEIHHNLLGSNVPRLESQNGARVLRGNVGDQHIQYASSIATLKNSQPPPLQRTHVLLPDRNSKSDTDSQNCTDRLRPTGPLGFGHASRPMINPEETKLWRRLQRSKQLGIRHRVGIHLTLSVEYAFPPTAQSWTTLNLEAT